VNTGASCDDGDSCTSFDTCADGVCAGTPEPNCGPAGSCLGQPDGTPCDDGDPCTVDSVCALGQCVGAAKDCSGANTQCGVGVCNPTTGACEAQPVANGTVCDDGDACTTGDACQGGQCLGTVDASCVYTGTDCSSLPDGTHCDDGDPCTVNTTCSGGVCSGSPKDCSALSTICATGTCNPADGSCVAVAAHDGWACDDGDTCTTGDACAAGVCAGTPDGSCLTACSGKADGTPCDDGDPCTVSTLCSGGQCVGQPKDCAALDGACAVGVCDAGTGACVAAPANNGASCDDGDLCTSGDTCDAGACVGTPSGACVSSCFGQADGTPCDDGDPCTLGTVCGGGTCGGGSAKDCSSLTTDCAVGVCDPVSGACVAQAANEGASCSDGDTCTIIDRCKGGQCVGTADPSCASGGADCAGQPDGTACDDGNPCTVQTTCQAGVCQGVPKDCSALTTDCTLGVCDGASGACVAAIANEGGVCDDGDTCTSGDMCQSGTCLGTDNGSCPAGSDGCAGQADGTPCDDGVPCTVDTTCQGGACQGTAKDCSALDSPCTVGVCDAATGACVTAPANDNGPCSDGDACTVGDVCQGGSCVGSPSGTCLDACYGKADLASCDDGNPCTVDDRCSGGVCLGTPKDCSAFDSACTQGVCDGLSGVCVAAPANTGTACDDGEPCTTGDTCSAGVCTGATDPSCVTGDGCAGAADGTPCDDSDPCTVSTVCVAGACVGSQRDCSAYDGDCTVGACDSQSGQCYGAATNDGAVCDDLDTCTTGDTCQQGQCVGTPDPACAAGGGDCTGLPDGTPCDDADPCTVNTTCQAGYCAGLPKDCSVFDTDCTVGVCNATSGACLASPANEGGGCDDLDACTSSDTCQSGVCAGTLIPSCVQGGADCTGKADGTPCDSGDLCTVNATCQSEVCVGQPKDCSALDSACTQGACDAASGVCQALAANEGGACNDLDNCTLADTCVSGICVGTADPACVQACTGVADGTPCDDADPCTSASACSGGACVGVPLDCSALDTACTVGTCDATSGTCVAAPTNNGGACDDGDSCTYDDVCQAGACVGTADPACGAGGNCAGKLPNTPCDDGDPCTVNTRCVSGVCQGDPVDCSAFNTLCTTGQCDAATGICYGAPVNNGAPCDDGDTCTTDDQCAGGQCVGTPNPVCNTADPCAGQPDGKACDDGDPCTVGTTCQAGACVGTPKDCSYLSTDCTVGLCDAASGNCYTGNTNEGGACDDGDSCTAGDSCAGGTCLGTVIPSCVTGSPDCVGVHDGVACLPSDPCITNATCQGEICVGTPRDCSAMDSVCTVGICNPADGTCVAANINEGGTCDDLDSCTSGDVCTGGVCAGTTDPSCLTVCSGKADGTPCDDGDPCTVGTTCSGGICAGTPRDCSAINTTCAQGICDPATGACVLAAVNNGGACDDGEACTTGDTCSAGTCQGTTDPACVTGCAGQPDGTACDDGDPCTVGTTCLGGACVGSPRDCSAYDGTCTVGTCNPANGLCYGAATNEGGACDDGEACTTGDVCTAGVCEGTADPACAAGGGDCTGQPDGIACDDGDPCTVNTTCYGGYCTGLPKDCSALDAPCQVGVCQAVSGDCIAQNTNEGGVCDDGNSCTTGDVCSGGVCAGSPDPTCVVGAGDCGGYPDGTACDDGNACTLSDVCTGGACVGQPKDCSALDGACTVGQCNPASGACVVASKNEGGVCDDGDSCTTGDTCQSGVCVGTTDPTCAGPCTGQPNGTPCDDGDPCTVNNTCQSGVCTGTAFDCSALDTACTVGLCDSGTGGCIQAPANNGGACDDGDTCTFADTCQDGVCSGTADPLCVSGGADCTGKPDGTACDDGDPCTVNTVCMAGTCSGQPKDCSAFDTDCTTGACFPQTGQCVGVPVTNGTVCDDGDSCTTGDTCTDGVCAGTDDPNCVTGTGCAGKPDGTACTDTDLCTVNTTCQGGVCTGPLMDCSALDTTCTVGACDGATGTCVANPTNEGGACDDGDSCTENDACASGVCTGTVVAGCLTACSGVADGTACDDGDACTVNTTCQAGQCVGSPRDCTALDTACTVGQCDPISGSCLSVAANEGAACDDGVSCTLNDTCQAGVCTGTDDPNCVGGAPANTCWQEDFTGYLGNDSHYECFGYVGDMGANAVLVSQPFDPSGNDMVTVQITLAWTHDGTGGGIDDGGQPCTTPPAPGDLMISELLADPGAVNDANQDGTVDTYKDEFVELVNLSKTRLDIGGVTISEGDGKVFTFPAGTCLNPGNSALMFGSYAGTGDFGGALAFGFGGQFGLNNTGDQVVVSDAFGTLLDSVVYGAEANNDESLTRQTDLDPAAPMVRHSLVAGAGGAAMSPGRCSNGNRYPYCDWSGSDATVTILATAVQGDWASAEVLDTVAVTAGENAGFVVASQLSNYMKAQSQVWVGIRVDSTTPDHVDVATDDFSVGVGNAPFFVDKLRTDKTYTRAADELTAAAPTTATLGETKNIVLWAHDPEWQTENLSFSLVGAPSFVTVANTTLKYVYGVYEAQISATPTASSHIGTYQMSVQVTDGTFTAVIPWTLEVKMGAGYVLYELPGVPAAHGDAIAAALTANGKYFQRVSDIYQVTDWSQIQGVFITAGAGAGARQLISYQPILDFMDAGGPVYMEGGATFAEDSQTPVQTRMQVLPVQVDAGVSAQFMGVQFMYPRTWNHSTNTDYANDVDALAPALGSTARIVLRHAGNPPDEYGVAVGNEDSQTGSRTIASSVLLSELLTAGADQTQFVERVLWFFENGWGGCTNPNPAQGGNPECYDGLECTDDLCQSGFCTNPPSLACAGCAVDADCTGADEACQPDGTCTTIPGTLEGGSTPASIFGCDSTDTTLTLTKSLTGFETVDDVHVHLAISMGPGQTIGPLQITLTHNGTTTTLRTADSNGDSALDLTYDIGALAAVGSMDDFNGLTAQGDWVLTITKTDGGGVCNTVTAFDLYLVRGAAVACVTDANCDNAQFCDGVERCVNNACVAGTAPSCDDGNPCTLDVCDSTANSGAGACDSSQRADSCAGEPCSGAHAYDAGDDQCGLQDACVGGLNGGAGTCTQVCPTCSVKHAPNVDTVVDDLNCVTQYLDIASGDIYVKNVFVRVDIDHPNLSDLMVKVFSPDNAVVTLMGNEGGANSGTHSTFPLSNPNSTEDLCSLSGVTPDGVWKVQVCDQTPGNVGTFQGASVWVETTNNDPTVGQDCGNAVPVLTADNTYTFTQDTTCLANSTAGGCGGNAGHDAVYTFDLFTRKRVQVQLTPTDPAGQEPDWDGVVYITDSCNLGSTYCADTALIGGAETLDQQLDPGKYFIVVDGADAGAYGPFTLNVTFTSLAQNGTACLADADCVSGHCANGFCCATGDCCTAPADCPASYSAASVCDTALTCQGHRVDPTCTTYQCGSVNVNDDTGCDTATVSKDCGLTQPVRCDGTADQTEPTCPAECLSDADCLSGAWCDAGGVCQPKKALGNACSADNECQSGACADGVCCNTACDGLCEACDIQGVVGTCTPISDGYDPEDECAGTGLCGGVCDGAGGCRFTPSTTTCDTCTRCSGDGFCNNYATAGTDPDNSCGNCQVCNGGNACEMVADGQDPLGDCATEPQSGCGQDGSCDGAGSCRLYAAGTVCVNQSCTAGVEDPAHTCDGAGTCVDPPDNWCNGFACNGASCLTSCANDGDCLSSYYCAGDFTCQPKKAQGQACSIDNECQTGFCADGVCCDGGCGGPCRQCNLAGSVGTCVNHAALTDPEGGCAPYYCDGAGNCDTTCATDADCGPGHWCNGTQCEVQKDNGTACTAGNQCTSGFCNAQDGVCCNSECGALCESCATGTCEVIAFGQDPDNECTGSGTCGGFCNGSRACVFPPNTTDCGTCQRCNGAGSCVAVPSQTDPDNDCPTCQTCDGVGACANVALGADPQSDCLDEGPCGLNGSCDGNGACDYYGAGTVFTGESCNTTTNTYSFPDTCDGSGAVNDGGTTSCAPYTCTGNGSGQSCKTQCLSQSDCASGYFCDFGDLDGDGNTNECIIKQSDGSACTSDSNDFECAGGYCNNGYCCGSDVACCATAADCQFMAEPAVCDSATGAGTCNGHRVDATCSGLHTCQTNTVADSSACVGLRCVNGSCGAPNTCESGTACTWTPNSHCTVGGTCEMDAAVTSCDDGNPCTYDQCDGATGCSHTDNNTYSEACYTGTSATRGVGNCQDGVKTCNGGTFGPCVGEVTPTTEVCGGGDEDCDALANEQGAVGCTTYWLDDDRDGYGTNTSSACYCAPGLHHTGAASDNYDVPSGGAIDCDDTNPAANPGQTEDCNTPFDDNCNSQVNEDGALNSTRYYRDSDGDGYGLGNDWKDKCTPAAPYSTTVSGDCDDGRGAVHPGASEICNGVDDDCDGGTDQNDPQESVASLCAAVPNGTRTCSGSAGCTIVSCTLHWYDVDLVYSNGCEVEEDAYDRNASGDSCSDYEYMGYVDDETEPHYIDDNYVGSATTYISGNIVPAGDVDWYYFYAYDESPYGHGINVDIRFQSGSGSGYAFEVYRSCTSSPVCTGETWYRCKSDFSLTNAGCNSVSAYGSTVSPCGQQNCVVSSGTAPGGYPDYPGVPASSTSPTNAHCADGPCNGGYYIKVYRPANDASPAGNNYKLQITNNAY